MSTSIAPPGAVAKSCGLLFPARSVARLKRIASPSSTKRAAEAAFPFHYEATLARLILVVAQHLAGVHIDQMHAGASHALERLVRLLIGGPSLHLLTGVWTTIEKRPRHRKKIAQTKRKKPQPED